MISSCLESSFPETAVGPGLDSDELLPVGGSLPDPAERLWRMANLGQVAESVVHDFNNILASISGFAELILMTSEPAGASRSGRDPAQGTAEFARHILQATAAGQSAVTSLRSLARDNRHEDESLDLQQVLGEALAMACPTLGPRIAVVREPSPVPAPIRGNRGLLQNAFLNLFLNARDAMPQGGTLQVRTSFPAPSQVMISIRDTGAGMSPEVLARIFDRFYTTKGPRGSGLGLPNVRRTVEMHRGFIEVESQPGSGTEFRLGFPLA